MNRSSPVFVPMVILLSIIVGILCHGLMGIGTGGVVCLIGISALLYCTVSVVAKFSSSKISWSRFHIFWITLLSIATGCLSASVFSTEYPVKESHYLVKRTGRILDITHKNSGELLTVELFEPKVKATVLTSGTVFSRGDLIEINAPLYPLKSEFTRTAVSDSDDARLGRYKESQIRRGILYSGKVNRRNLRCVGYEWTLKSFALDIRDRLEIGIEKTGLNPATKDFLITLLLGDKSYLNPELRQTFSDVGVSHILAVSGLHTGIIASVLLAIFYPFNMIRRRKWKYVASLVLIWIFVFITGLQPSTIRSAIMISCLSIGIVTERRFGAGRSLCWAAIAILLLTPSSLYDPGFQLSFACVAGLIVFGEKLNPLEKDKPGVLRKIVTAILATLISTGCTWIIVAYYFGCFPTMFLPANLFILPFVPLYLFGTFLYLGLSAMGMNSMVLESLLDKSLELTVGLCRLLSSEGSTVIHVRPDMTAVCLWVAGIALTGLWLYTEKRRLVAGLPGVACLLTSLYMVI